ncbi:MAG TPA: cytochrome c [Blastocatellia bacterium]|nr:cytochrome c [Blastocatellia bacterium]
MGERANVTPVEEGSRIRAGRIETIIVVVLFLAGTYLFWSFNPNAPVDYVKIEDHFKYGSIGSDVDLGIPYWIWKVLPDVFADKLPGEGYESLGFVQEPGHDTPIGFSKRRVGLDRVGLNCAVCHTGTVRDTPDSQRRIYPGMPANTMNLQAYYRFLFDCVRDGRFTGDNILTAIEARKRLNMVDRFFYRTAVAQVREGVIEQSSKIMDFMKRNPDWGPGRVDTFNPYKAIQFNWPMDTEETVGTADLPSIWNQKPREGMQLHWDGNNDSVEERNKSAALGAGVTPPTLDLRRLKRIEEWLWDQLKAPPYPYEINQGLADQGEVLFRQHCYECHAFGGEKIGKVVPIDEIKTDPHRLDSFTYELAENQNTLYAGYEYRFNRFRKTNGYANAPLDGVWLRAPYLHNGSVPTLRELLEPPENRTKLFYRGYDVYDRKNVGFISGVPAEGNRQYFKYDTALPGNGNWGHLYGIGLTPQEKDALVEYMKKL